MYPVYDMSYITDRSDVDPNTGCWNWNKSSKGSGKNKYGQGKVAIGNKFETLAHRISFYLYYGYEAYIACHTCHNTQCVNPHHIYSGTPQTNMDDRKLDNTTCEGTKNGRCLLSENDVLEVRTLYATGKYSQHQLGDMFGVSRSAIAGIVSGKNWKTL